MAPAPGGRQWLRSLDSNQGPSGYEPDELPLLHSARSIIPADFQVIRTRSWVRGGRRSGWIGDEEHLLARLRVAAQARLLLVGRAVVDRLDVLPVAVVLRGDHAVLAPEVGDLLRELVADEGLLRIADERPRGDDGE